jgi:putative oxidoreductase
VVTASNDHHLSIDRYVLLFGGVWYLKEETGYELTMALSSKLARPMMAAMFVVGALDALGDPDSKVETAEPGTSEVVPPLGLPEDTAKLVRLNGAVQLTAGTLLGLSRLPRLSAGALAMSLVPTTLAGHRFWEETDKQKRVNDQTHFFKNLAMLGGLVLAAVDTEGRPSVPYRARKAVRKVPDVLPVPGQAT